MKTQEEIKKEVNTPKQRGQGKDAFSVLSSKTLEDHIKMINSLVALSKKGMLDTKKKIRQHKKDPAKHLNPLVDKISEVKTLTDLLKKALDMKEVLDKFAETVVKKHAKESSGYEEMVKKYEEMKRDSTILRKNLLRYKEMGAKYLKITEAYKTLKKKYEELQAKGA